MVSNNIKHKMYVIETIVSIPYYSFCMILFVCPEIKGLLEKLSFIFCDDEQKYKDPSLLFSK